MVENMIVGIVLLLTSDLEFQDIHRENLQREQKIVLRIYRELNYKVLSKKVII